MVGFIGTDIIILGGQLEVLRKKNVVKKLKGYILELVELNSERYWDLRWQTNYDSDGGVDGCQEQYKTVARDEWKNQIIKLMQTCECQSILDVGCGKAWLRELDGYLGLDRSREVFKHNGLSNFLVADATKQIPLPSKSFDAVISFFFLMHQTPEKVLVVSGEMMRVAKKLIVLREDTSKGLPKNGCFKHDYLKLFQNFEGKMEMLEW